jgi:hypothetical protein
MRDILTRLLAWLLHPAHDDCVCHQRRREWRTRNERPGWSPSDYR